MRACTPAGPRYMGASTWISSPRVEAEIFRDALADHLHHPIGRIFGVSAGKEKKSPPSLSGDWENGHLPLVDAVGIGDDLRAGCLAEDGAQAGDRRQLRWRSRRAAHPLRPRTAAGPHRRPAAGAYPGRSGFEQVVGQQQIQHGGFVHHQEIDSSGFSALCLKPSTGEKSSRRWMVLAGRPVASESRLAARPVGEARAYACRRASSAAIRAFRQVVLPVPGPPVSTLTGWLSAVRMAACCSCESSAVQLDECRRQIAQAGRAAR